MKTKFFAILTLVVSLVGFVPSPAQAFNEALPVRIDYTKSAVGSAGSSGYAQLVGSLIKGVAAVSVYNSGSAPIELALGSAGNEVVQMVVPPQAASAIAQVYPLQSPYGVRVSVISLGQNNSTGELDVNFFYN